MHRLNNFAGKLLGLFLKIITTLNYYLNTIVTDSISAAIFFPPKFNKSVMTYEVQLNHFRVKLAMKFAVVTSTYIHMHVCIYTKTYTSVYTYTKIHFYTYYCVHSVKPTNGYGTSVVQACALLHSLYSLPLAYNVEYE